MSNQNEVLIKKAWGKNYDIVKDRLDQYGFIRCYGLESNAAEKFFHFNLGLYPPHIEIQGTIMMQWVYRPIELKEILPFNHYPPRIDPYEGFTVETEEI